MTVKIVLQGIIVQRNGKNSLLPVGEPFDFSDAELADIAALNPDAIRDPIVEVTPATPATAKKSTKTEDL